VPRSRERSRAASIDAAVADAGNACAQCPLPFATDPSEDEQVQTGTVVANRFVIEAPAGHGGMGDVYRARDRETGGAVALKVLRTGLEGGLERFRREVSALAALSHPNIVTHVAHGTTDDGAPFVAMEWIEGGHLGARLQRGKLSVSDALLVGRQLADALGTAHARGLVHRDVKPSNVLVLGDLGHVKLIDFGLARSLAPDDGPSAAGMVIGTPGYMAPEQVRGFQIDARADVFALGCVLYKCLTGKAPFAGGDSVGVLAKVLFEDPPKPSELATGIDAAIDALIAGMLSKEPGKRPRDAVEVARKLAVIAEATSRAPPSMPALGRSERRVVSIVLAGHTGRYEAERTLRRSSSDLDGAVLASVVEPFGAQLELLPDGSIVLVMSGERVATDQATRAAQCALALRAALPRLPMALATGRAELGGRIFGEAIDRATALLRMAAGAELRIDEVTAGLLDARFDIGAGDLGFVLRGERASGAAARTLLGKASACVGRDRELGLLLSVFDECAAESCARAVVVTAPAGTGKSRLRYEMLRAIEGSDRDVQTWIARAESMGAGSPFAMIASMLMHTAGVLESEPLEVRQQKLRARVARNVGRDSDADLQRVTEFLGEIVGTPFPDEDRVQLRAARRDPVVMADQTKRAFCDFLAAECAERPLCIVLEDVHWGDRPSITFVDAALRVLGGAPLFVLALARPEVSEVFPSLFAKRGAHEIRLAGLSRRASEQLVRDVLGPGVAPATVARIVERAGGNAFYLEELIRAVAEGSVSSLPETVIAMAEGRLEALSPDLRRVLRAASILGQTFWRDAVHALLGADEPVAALAARLDELLERELVTARGEGRFPGQPEYAFRHAIVREAAYAMLTDADRALGHGLAGEWLEAAGDRDAVVLAEHFERARMPARARIHYRRAAEAALDASDFTGAVAQAASAERCGLSGVDLGKLRVLEAEAHRWQGESEKAIEHALDAMSRLQPSSDDYFRACAEASSATMRTGDAEAAVQVAETLRAGLAEAPTPAAAVAGARTSAALLLAGRVEQADALLALLDPEAFRDPTTRAEILRARAMRALVAGDPAAHVRIAEQAVASFDEAGDVRAACVARTNVGFGLMELGFYDDAERELRAALATAERMGLAYVVAGALHNLGLTLSRQGRFDEALEVERRAVDEAVAQRDRRVIGASRVYLAMIHAEQGAWVDAERAARDALEVLGDTPPVRIQAKAVLADALRRQGRVGDALAAACDAMAELAVVREIEEGDVLLHTVYAECLLDAADPRAEGAVRAAADRVSKRAGSIADDSVRARFLEAIPENARALELARSHGVR
jgi:tetratricopeptide (TPR) repeat protein